VLGDEALRGIVGGVVESAPNNVTIDWALRENVPALLSAEWATA
jgi:hypothetical protein